MHILGLLARSLRRRAGVVFIHRAFRPALAYLFTISSQLRYCKHGDVMFDVVVRHRHRLDKYLDTLLANQPISDGEATDRCKSLRRKMADCPS